MVKPCVKHCSQSICNVTCSGIYLEYLILNDRYLKIVLVELNSELSQTAELFLKFDLVLSLELLFALSAHQTYADKLKSI